MRRAASQPPRLAERLLSLVLRNPQRRDAVLGDLHEEFATHSLRGSHVAALWYWSQAVQLTIRYAARPERDRRHRRTTSGVRHVDSLLSDLRLAIRALLKSPLLTATVTVTLGLGLGANAAIFACIDALVLRPFQFPDVDRIVMIAETEPDDISPQEAVAPANFLDWREQTNVFAQMVATDWWNANLVGRDEPERVQGFRVSAEFFSVLGAPPVVGRAFTRDEQVEGRHRAVVLGHGLWERRFAADPAIVGQTVIVDGLAHVVLGIAPRGFDFPNGCEVWAPLAFDREAAVNRKTRYLSVFARLADGKSLDDAQTQMSVISERLAREHPENRDRGVRVYTLAQGMLDVGLGPILSMWQAAAAVVLLIACANITNLLLARGAGRTREVAVRLAIGASRARVLRGLLIESVVLAIAAIPFAILVSWISVSLIRAFLPARLTRFVAGWHTIDVDARMLTFTAAAALVTGVVFGMLPAFQTSRARLAEMLKEGGRSSSAGPGRQRVRRALVVAEMALALPLLVAAALSVISTQRFLNGPQGYNPDGLVTMRIVLTEGRYRDDVARRGYATRTIQELESLPSVTSAALANNIPSGGSNLSIPFEIQGRPHPDPAKRPSVDLRLVTGRFFETMELPILRGRGITNADRETTQPVVVVSTSMAAKYWPSGNTVGSHIRLGDDPTWITVVGISDDVIHDWFAHRNRPTAYRPFPQAPTGFTAAVVRTSDDPSASLGAIRQAMRRVDPTQPISDLMTMRHLLHDRTIGLQYISAIMGVFAGLAFILAVVGVYATMAYLLTLRTHEIGVRVALGATARDVVRMTLRDAARITATGVGLGIALSFALNRFIEAGLLGVVSSDARLLAGLATALVAAALVSAYLPARRASSVDPAVVLRAE